MSNNSNIKILTVDDNEALRYSLKRSLQGGGYHVIEARNGAEALMLAEDGPELITLDINLPDMDGFEICRRLKSNPKTAHIPVLHISATYVNAEHRVRGLEAADGYLAEPISRDELLATVGALLRLKKAEREAKIHAAEAEKARHELKITHDELEARVAQRTKELADSNGQIRELTGKLFKLQDDERRRIARELHDSTGQMLTAMKMNLDRLKSKATKSDYKDLIAETISINDDLTSQLRTMSYLLHPPLLDEIGLPSAIQWYTKGFAQRSGIKVNAEIVADLGRLPNDMELAIFRFVQEALTNIHRHSGSRTADIRIVRQDDRIHVEVVDSGNGIAPEKLRGDHVIQGIGIMGIQERVRQLGGAVEIKSSSSGTTITANLPSIMENRQI
jgi:signal transduction histidine kinase